jgi:hypothetical protein
MRLFAEAHESTFPNWSKDYLETFRAAYILHIIQTNRKCDKCKIGK